MPDATTPRDIHRVQPTGMAWAKPSAAGDEPLLLVELSTEDEAWLVGLTRPDAEILRRRLETCLKQP